MIFIDAVTQKKQVMSCSYKMAICKEQWKEDRIIYAIREAACKFLGIKTLKPLQEEVIVKFIHGKDAFVGLPTDFGKSFCYGCLLSVYDSLKAKTGSIVIVVSPLLSLMNDQVS